ncbi:MAG TPA: ribbon-helix-helix protein, CopG family [Terriglobia bacterium]|nr:ribbon-helix-helix protein, CopG family [Terriglobia bacterium]
MPVPERKGVFTVKLPLSLISRLRQLARSTGASLSALVTQALEAFLKRREHG